MLNKLDYRLALAGRHQLDYKKLYHNYEGGYDIDTLKSVLLGMKDDREKRGLSLESLYSTRKNPLL